MLVRNAMTTRAETIGPEETLEVAARKMRELGVGALVVCEREALLGMITDRDIVVRSVARGREPAYADVRSAMTPQVLTCREAEPLDDAVRRMEERAVRRLVVLDDAGHMVGLLSVDDVALVDALLAGEAVGQVRAPGRSVHRGNWPWWEEAAT